MRDIYLRSDKINKMKVIDSGGEAKIYQWNRSIVLKIFNKKIDIEKKKKKIDIYLQNKNYPSNLIKPLSRVFLDGIFVGYSMKFLENQKCLKELLDRRLILNGEVSLGQLLNISIKIGETINKLHSLGIIIGDINPCNILVIGETPYFIDCDSYGVNDKLTPDAFSTEFFDPMQIKDNNSRIFSKEGDLYSYAVLTFHLLTGQHPFGGYYMNNPYMKMEERMKNKISVLGSEDIKVLDNLSNWGWMPNYLIDEFLCIFEQGRRNSVLGYLNQCKNRKSKCKEIKISKIKKFKTTAKNIMEKIIIIILLLMIGIIIFKCTRALILLFSLNTKFVLNDFIYLVCFIVLFLVIIFCFLIKDFLVELNTMEDFSNYLLGLGVIYCIVLGMGFVLSKFIGVLGIVLITVIIVIILYFCFYKE